MTAEEIIQARRKVNLPTKMKVRHEKFGECIVWAYARVQAEMAAALHWKCSWDEEHSKMHMSVLNDQSGYEEACRV